nr:MAG TPA: hypothetical protein [Caudoviricetes sp.]DAO80419.1 MAG TPA: hypothetical protein [Caudoviricetes sp.]
MLALPPTCSSSTIYYLFFAHSVVAETYARNGLTFILCNPRNPKRRFSTLRFQSFVFYSCYYINFSLFCLGACRLM